MGDHVEGGRFKRFAKLATAAALTTRDVIAAQAKKRVLGQDEAAFGAGLEPTAARLVAVLGELKGAATKLGQLVSLVDQDTFPEEARKILSRLLSQAPHRMTVERAGEVVARDLGAPPEEVFKTFSDDPIAAASVGQVHAATLHDGRRVVVKVQYPGIERSIESDMKNVGIIARALSFGGGLLDGRAYLQEITDSLRRELDYREEAKQLEEYREAARPWLDRLAVPEVIATHTGQHVLTLERFDGPTVLELAHDSSVSSEKRYDVAVRLVEAVWGPFLRARLIHADPHPGNYICLADGRLGVLDFGATKRLSVPFTLAYRSMVRTVLGGGFVRLTDVLEGAGFELHGDREHLETWLQALAAIVERPIRNPVYDWEQCRISADVRDHFAGDVVSVLRCRAPVEGLMFYRAAAGAAGDFRLLRARGDFQGALRRLFEVATRELAPELVSGRSSP